MMLCGEAKKKKEFGTGVVALLAGTPCTPESKGLSSDPVKIFSDLAKGCWFSNK